MVIEPPADKPHGLRECTVLSPEGYAFSPAVPRAEGGEVTITRLGHLGDGIGDGPRGQAVYAARTLPGRGDRGRDRGRPDRDARHRDTVAGAGRAALRPLPELRGLRLMHASEVRCSVEGRRHRNGAAGAGSGGADAAHRDLPAPVAAARHAGGTADEEGRAGGLPRAAVGHDRADHGMPRADARLLAVVPVLGEITRLGGSRAGVLSFAMTLTDKRRGPARDGGQAARRATARRWAPSRGASCG
jgi:hypothetical protein